MAFASVLLVDDDLVASASARGLLSAAGYTVDDCLNGQRALRRVMANPPDVLITEILMPDGDGIELITAVKRFHLDMRIIAITNRRFLGGLDLFDLASKLGADATLDKPLKAGGFLATVARLTGSEGAVGVS